jgi:hypothetical protein
MIARCSRTTLAFCEGAAALYVPRLSTRAVPRATVNIFMPRPPFAGLKATMRPDCAEFWNGYAFPCIADGDVIDLSSRGNR